MKKYEVIRSEAQRDRCKAQSIWGSPMYCDCGCQTPRDSDPDLEIEDLVVGEKTEEGYANVYLLRGKDKVGRINTQYNYIYLDGVEYLGVDKQYIAGLITQARHVLDSQTSARDTGDTIEETASQESRLEAIEIAEQDNNNKRHHGYCVKCHSYCYGDCEEVA